MYRSLKTQQIFSFVVAISACTVAGANPLHSNATVVHGDVSFNQPNSHTLNITNSPGSVINWQSFNIRSNETTRFIQQSAASTVLNRVTGAQVSRLNGNLNSNGRVFLINGNGIIVGAGATIDTAGLVMSTLDISNEDFVAGNFNFSGDEDAGQITNRGYIKTAPGGEIILLAPRIVNESIDGVENSGLIETEGGELILAAGYAITITSLDDPDISFDVESTRGEVVNLGQLIARGGSAEILARTIRHSGEINADAIEVDEHGQIRLVASERIDASRESVISAKGVGDGGTITIEAVATEDSSVSKAVMRGTIVADGENNGGRIEVLGEHVRLHDAVVTANGASGGGDIRIGGEIQGGAGLPAADTVTVKGNTRISADATIDGDGGRVAVWSEQKTKFLSYASARGGNEGGNGGFVEVSGKRELVLQGSLDVGALAGDSGSILLDPENIFIVPGSDSVELLDPTPGANDRFSSSFSVLANGNILVRNQDADIGSRTDAGEILLFTPQGELIGTLEGGSSGERLGSLFQNTVTDGNLVFRSPNAGANNRGAVILFNDDTGVEIGRVTGASANDQLGLVVDFFGVPANTYAIQNELADVGGKVDAGTLILVNDLTGLEIGRVSGFNAGDMVGSNQLIVRPSGNYYVPVPNADVSGMVDAGSLFLVNGTTGNFIGRINGNNAGEMLSSNINTGSFSPDALITSTTHNNGGFTDAGAMILAADIDLGGGNFERGRVMGTSTGEMLGSDGFQFLSNGNYAIFSTAADAGGVDSGSVILADRTTGNEIGRLDGDSANEFLGSFGVIESTNGNYWVQSPDSDPMANADAGTLYLVDGASGAMIARFDGDTAGEQFSQNTQQNSNVGFDQLIVSSENNGNDTGFVGLFDSVDLGGGNFLEGSVTGGQSGDLLGNGPLEFLGNGNYVIGAPDYQNGSDPAVGAVFVVDNADGTAVLGPILGDTINERLGDFGDLDLSTLASNDNFLIISPDHNNGAGQVIFVAGTDVSAMILNTVDGFLSTDAVGAEGVFAVAGGVLIPIPDHGFMGGPANTGKIVLVDNTGALIQEQFGTTANEKFGQDIDFFSLGGDILVNNFGSDVGGIDSGQLVALDPNTLVINWMIDGTAGEQLGMSGGVQQLSSGNFLFFSEFEDTGGADAGRIIMADNAGAVIGSLFGQAANENLGSAGFVFESTNGNYFARSTNASPGAVNQAGSVYLGDGTTGLLIGQADGTAIGENFGTTIDFLSNPLGDVIVRSSSHTVGGFTNAGTAVQLASSDLGAGNIIRGRIDGSSTGEFFGAFGSTSLQNNNLVFRSSGADPGGRVDAGSIFIYNPNTGSTVGQVNGTTAGDLLGSNGIVTTSNNNFYLPVPNADISGRMDAGELLAVNGNSGSVLGRLQGTATNERLGDLTSLLDADDLMVRAPLHTVGSRVGAGAIFRVTNRNLGGGNITVGMVSGANANDGLGTFFPSFFTDLAAIRSPDADPGGISDAGSLVFFNPDTFSETNRINGLSAGERFSANGLSFVSSNVRYVRSPDADVNGLMDAGSVVIVNVLTGQELARNNGISAGERFGAFSPTFLSNGQLLFPSPDADVNGLVDAGRFVFLDASGLANNPLTDFTFDNLPSDDFFITNTTLEGLLNSGANLTLQANNDIITQIGADIMATAGQLTLQAGRSIRINSLLSVPTLNLVSNETVDNGALAEFREEGTGDLVVHAATARADNTLDVSAEYVKIEAGTGLDAFAAIISLGTLNIDAHSIEIFGGEGSGLGAAPLDSEFFSDFIGEANGLPPFAVAFGFEQLNVVADNILLQGGSGDQAFAALASNGLFSVTANTAELIPGEGSNADAAFLALGGVAEVAIGTCIGCDQLFFDPLLDPLSQSGIYIAGLLQDPSTNAILAMLDRDEEEDEEDEGPGECN